MNIPSHTEPDEAPGLPSPSRNRARVILEDEDDIDTAQGSSKPSQPQSPELLQKATVRVFLHKQALPQNYAASRTALSHARIKTTASFATLPQSPKPGTQSGAATKAVESNKPTLDAQPAKVAPSIESDTSPVERNMKERPRRRLVRGTGSPKERKHDDPTDEADEQLEASSAAENSDVGATEFPTVSELKSRLKQRLQDLEESHCGWMRKWLRKARVQIDQTGKSATMEAPPKRKDARSPFIHLEQANSAMGASNDTSTDTGRSRTTVDNGVHVITYSSTTPPVPYYTHYTSIETNVLSENMKTLMVYPQITRDAEDKYALDQVEVDLRNEFNAAIPEKRAERLQNRTETALYRSVILEFIAEEGIELHDLLHALLDPQVPKLPGDVKTNMFNLRHQQGANDRRAAMLDGFSLDLPPSADSDIVLACFACVVIHGVCKLSVYDTVTQLSATTNKTTNNPKADQRQDPRTKQSLMCRVCFMSECPFHGEYPDVPWDEDTTEYQAETVLPRKRITMPAKPLSLDDLVSSETFVMVTLEVLRGESVYARNSVDDAGPAPGTTDREPFKRGTLCSEACFWKETNRDPTMTGLWAAEDYREMKRLLMTYATDSRGPCIMALLLDKPCIQVFNEARAVLSAHAKGKPLTQQSNAEPVPSNENEPRSAYIEKWRQTKTHDLAARSHTFVPCSHKGSCETAACECYKNRTNCEKSCRCETTCDRRFKGCKCRRKGVICFQSDKCACFQLNRECDPDLCGSCGAIELLDPANEQDDPNERRCGNVGIQRNDPKRTILGSAGDAGYGLFMGEAARKNDYLGEYKGESLSHAEGARRGASYHFQRVNYLFGFPSKEQEADATYAGNKTRFINHSSDPKYINCSPGVYICNTVTRIGFYAQRDLLPGEELLFDYRYGPEHLKRFREKDGTRSSDVAARTGKKQRASLTTSKTAAGVASGAPLAAAKSSISFTSAGQQSFGFTRAGRQVDGEEDRDSDSLSEPDDNIEDIFKDIPLPPDNPKDEDYTAGAISSPRTPTTSRPASPEAPSTRARRRQRALADL